MSLMKMGRYVKVVHYYVPLLKSNIFKSLFSTDQFTFALSFTLTRMPKTTKPSGDPAQTRGSCRTQKMYLCFAKQNVEVLIYRHKNTIIQIKNIYAPGEARTHGLQIMRLTRCLLRYGGLIEAEERIYFRNSC